MAHCGLTSHYIRKVNVSIDANIFSSKNNFNHFKSFVFNQIKKDGFLDLYKQLFLLKQRLNSENKNNYFLKKYITVLMYFNRPKILFRLVHWVLFRDRISKVVAYKWIKNL